MNGDDSRFGQGPDGGEQPVLTPDPSATQSTPAESAAIPPAIGGPARGSSTLGLMEPPAGPRPGEGPPPVPYAQPRRRWWTPETRRTPDRPCLNCGDTTVGFFCPVCGQRKADVRISLRRMLLEVLDDQLSLNSALPRTMGAVLFRPGLLTKEYVQGRIARYIPPFRLYLVSSVVFFLVLSTVANRDLIADLETPGAEADSTRSAAAEAGSEFMEGWNDSGRENERRRDASPAARDSAAATRTAARDSVAPRRAGRDTAAAPARRNSGANISVGDSGKTNINLGWDDSASLPAVLKPINRRMERTEQRLNRMPPREAIRTLLEAFERNAPTAMFLLMPAFAVILKLLYVRRKRFYVEHFVFALHVHSFAFILFTVMLLSPWSQVVALSTLWFGVYLYMAMRRVYGQGWFRTLVKYTVLGFAYFVVLTAGLTITAIISALTM